MGLTINLDSGKVVYDLAARCSASAGHIIVTDPWSVQSDHIAATSHHTALVSEAGPRPRTSEGKRSLSISSEHFATENSLSRATFRLLWPQRVLFHVNAGK
jgi:hypothetical protein